MDLGLGKKFSKHPKLLSLFALTEPNPGSKSYLNSDHISNAEPEGKNLRQDRTREVTVSKCRCLILHPSGPVFL